MIKKYKKNIDNILKEFENTKNDRLLIYACLELRMLIEEASLNILKQYTKVIDKIDREEWKPPQIMNLLAKYEENIYLKRSIKLFKENDKNIPIIQGDYIPLPKGRKLSTLYHSLSSYLHCQKENQKDVTIEKFKEKMFQIEEIIDNKKEIYFSITENINFICGACGIQNSFTQFYLDNNKQINCQNNNCGILLDVVKKNEDYTFNPHIIFECDCGTPQYLTLPPEKIYLGLKYKCTSCKSVYKVNSYNLEKL